jgi:N-acetylglucosaminyldiphosphoundecaprenol N-acetyl-beta-D-mannosaminyltransferase
MSEKIRKKPFFGYEILAEQVKDIRLLEKENVGLLINTLNPHSFYVAEHDTEFKEALVNSGILLPDGVGVVLANFLINGTILRRISGMDFFLTLLHQLNYFRDPSRNRIFFLGSTVENLELIKGKISEDFPFLKVAFYSPPYKSLFSEEDKQKIIHEINAFDPYLIFVGMTAPKQEKWAYQNAPLTNAKILCSIGAVFDFYSGRIKRPGKLWRVLGLEWLKRFLGEPRRLWKRNFISLPYFLGEVFKEVWRKKTEKAV